MEKFWWQNQPLTISAIQKHVEEGSDRAFDEYVSKSYFNVEQLKHLFSTGGGMTCYEDDVWGETLEEYLKKSRPTGIREIIYTNTHCLSPEISDSHPEYWERNKDGEPLYGYGIYKFACINPSGDFHKKLLKELSALARRDIDGIFLDGPIMSDKGCYCEKCQKGFEESFGHSIFQSTERERLIYRVDIATQHMKEIYEAVKKINPNIAVYLNNSALRPDVTGSNTRRLYEYTDLLGAEGGFHGPFLGGDIWQMSAFLKQLEGIIGDPIKEKKPYVNFFNQNEAGRPEYLHTPLETKLSYAHTLAAGANVWHGIHGSLYDMIDTEAIKVAKEMNKFILDNKDLFSATKTCARVALMWSEITANNYASSVAESDFTEARGTGYTDRGDHRTALFAVVDMLERGHVQFDIIDEYSIERGFLANYDTLILPTVACMTDSVANKIDQYIKDGGNVIGSFAVGMYDEKGEYLGKSKLAEAFGFDGTPKFEKILSAYVYKEADSPILDCLYSKVIPAPLLSMVWEVRDDVKVLMRSSHTKTSYYGVDENNERYPAIWTRKHGKGKVYYLSGTYFESYIDARNNADYKNLFGAIINDVTKEVVVSNEAGLYEVVLRKQEDRFILHIVNMTGAMMRPYEKLVPLINAKFKLNLSGFGIKKDKFTLRSICEAKLENLEQNGEEISFTLDKINEYEIIVIE